MSPATTEDIKAIFGWIIAQSPKNNTDPMNQRSVNLTDDDAPAYLLARVTRTDAEADQAKRQERELDAIQQARGQKKPRRVNPSCKRLSSDGQLYDEIPLCTV